MSHLPSQIPPFALPENIPQTLPQQQFQLGDSVRWRQVPHSGFGRILGVIYTHSASCIATGLHYLVLLDQQSPSRHITSSISPSRRISNGFIIHLWSKLQAIRSEAIRRQRVLQLHN